MARGKWLSDEERQRILSMRQAGVTVKSISAHMGRSSHFIYRALRNSNATASANSNATPASSSAHTGGNGGNDGQKSWATAGSATTSVDALVPAVTFAYGVGATTNVSSSMRAPSPQVHKEDSFGGMTNSLGLPDSTVALLCDVESMEASCEPIPFVRPSVQTQRVPEPRQPHPGPYEAMINSNADIGGSTGTHRVTSGSGAQGRWSLDGESTAPSHPPSAPSTKASRPQQTLAPARSQQHQGHLSDAVLSSSAPPLPESSSVLTTRSHQQTQCNLETASRGSEESGLLQGLFARIQAEIHRLEAAQHPDIYDAQLLQILVKFQAEMQLVHLQKTHSVCGKRSRGQEPRRTSADDGEMERLLRSKLAMEVELMNVQANREKLQLQREQIRHRLASDLCRLRLQVANVAPADVDRLFPSQ